MPEPLRPYTPKCMILMASSTTAVAYTTTLLISIRDTGVSPSPQAFEARTELSYGIRIQGSVVGLIPTTGSGLDTVPSRTLLPAIGLASNTLSFTSQPEPSFRRTTNIRNLPNVDTPTTTLESRLPSTPTKL